MRRAILIILTGAVLAACGSTSNPSAVLCHRLRAQAAHLANSILSPMGQNLTGAQYRTQAAAITASQLATLSQRNHVVCP